MDRCEGKAIIRLTANYNRLLNGVDGLITFISGNRRRQSLLVRFSRLSRCDPRRSTSNIYRARLSASNCNRLAFVVGEKLAIVFANVFHSPRRPAFRGESQREKREREKKRSVGGGLRWRRGALSNAFVDTTSRHRHRRYCSRCNRAKTHPHPASTLRHPPS